MAPKRHGHLTHHHLGNIKLAPTYSKTKQLPFLPPRKTSNYHPPITKHLVQQKNPKFCPNADMRTNTNSHFWTNTHNPSILPIPPPLLKLPSNDPTTHPTLRKYHRSTSLMSSFLLPEQCPACLVRLTWITS